MYEVTVKSTAEERYDGVIDAAVRGTLDGVVGITYTEGGVAFDETLKHPADNHFGLDARDEVTARNAAAKIAHALNRPVSYYPYGRDVDPETAPRFTANPTDPEE